MRFRTKLVFCGLGALAVGLGTIATVPAKNTAVLVNYHDYAQTLPADVIGTLPPDQQQAWTNATRYGAVSGEPGTVVPVNPSEVETGVGGVGAGVVSGATDVALIAGQLTSTSGAKVCPKSTDCSQDGWWKGVVGAPSWISASDWAMCNPHSGDGYPDWLTGAEAWVDSIGTSIAGEGTCADIQKKWIIPKNSAYVPSGLGGAGSPATGYPATLKGTAVTRNSTMPIELDLGVPVWNPNTTVVNGVTRQIGWVVPYTLSAGACSDNGGAGYCGANAVSLTMSADFQQLDANGDVVAGQAWGTTVYANQQSRSNLTLSITMWAGAPNAAGCAVGYNQCLPLDWVEIVNGSQPGSTPGLVQRTSLTGVVGLGSGSVNGVLPYHDVGVSSGAPVVPPGQVYMMVTDFFEDGTTSSCKTVNFVETDPVIPQPCDPAVPPGEVPTKQIKELVPASEPSYVPGSNPTRTVATTTVPQPTQDWESQYPQCTGKVCILDLQKTGVGSCLDHPTDCAGWYTDPSKTTDYTCTYDGTTIDLSQCANYARLFEPDAVTSGTAYPSSSTDPTAPPTTSTSTAPGPTEAPGDAVQDPDSNRNCWANGWSWNPVDWVMTPVRCALEWAFVPRQSVVDTYLGNMRAVWAGSSLVSLLNVLQDAVGLTVNAGGCDGPEIQFAVYGASYDGHPLSACDAPMSNVASFSWWFTGALAWVLAIATIARSIAGVVAFKGIGGGGSE